MNFRWLVIVLLLQSVLLFGFNPSKVIEPEIYEESVNQLVIEMAGEYFGSLINKEITDNDLKLHLISLGLIESNWKFMQSFKPNANGTMDLGPLGLNSNNIKSSYFMEKYSREIAYKYKNDDKNAYYMFVCIELYKELYDKYGDDATLIYNGGIGNYLRGTTPAVCHIYKARHLSNIDKLNKTAETIAAHSINKQVNGKNTLSKMRSESIIYRMILNIFRMLKIRDFNIYEREEYINMHYIHNRRKIYAIA